MRRYFGSYLHSTSPNRISLILGGSQAEINDFVPNPTEEAHALPRITQFIVSRTSCLEPRSPQERPLQGQAPNSGRSLGRGFLVRIPGERKFEDSGLQEKQSLSADVSRCFLASVHWASCMFQTPCRPLGLGRRSFSSKVYRRDRHRGRKGNLGDDHYSRGHPGAVAWPGG